MLQFSHFDFYDFSTVGYIWLDLHEVAREMARVFKSNPISYLSNFKADNLCPFFYLYKFSTKLMQTKKRAQLRALSLIL